MTPEPVDFGGEVGSYVDEGRDKNDVALQEVRHVDVRGHLDLTVHVVEGGNVPQRVIDSLAHISRALVRVRHLADANRSGCEGQGSLGGEPAGELREDREVGVEPDAIQSSDAERQE
jgi:hypothetical protein